MKNKSKNTFLFFMSILMMTVMLASTSRADTPFWNSSWNHRKQIAITNNVEAVLYDYSMMISLNTAELISQGKMQTDCGDIRIIENGAEINYGIKNPNSPNTEIYFIAHDLIAGENSDIYLYYGNPDADNGFVENWKDAFYIWYDDFDTDRGWDNCPGNTRPGTVTVDTVNGWLYAQWNQYNDYHVCPTDGSTFPMGGRVGFKAETRIMAENDYLCQIQVILGNSSYVQKVPIINFRVGHNDYIILWDSRVPKSLDDDVWYEATAVYNRLTGEWYGEFANDGIKSGIRTPQPDDDFSTIILDICNGINMYLDYLYLRCFIEPQPSYSLQEEENALKLLNLLSPDGGENILAGAMFDIKWEFSPLIEEHDVKIEYSSNGGKCCWAEVVTTDNDGQYEWQVPTFKSDRYLVKITDVNDPNFYDMSRETFKVGSCREVIPGDINGDCIVNLFDFAILANNFLLQGYHDFYKASLDTNPLWQTQGEWAFGPPQGQGGDIHGYPDPDSGYTGANVYGVNLNGDYSTDIGGPYYLTAGPFSCKYYSNIILKFARWLNTDVSNYTDAKIEVSNDGTTWVTIWNNTNVPITDNSWKMLEYDIGSVADGQESVYIRWSYSVFDHAYPYSGWNIDDIGLWGKPK